jgi:cytochrome c biogenesis protein CcmG/thiol:disulfide interchange protein DsbE
MLRKTGWACLLLLGVTFQPARAAPKADPLVGKAAPAFTLSQLDGKRLSLASLKGKVALLNFWDFGCPSCNLEVKHLQRLHRMYAGEGLRVVGIAELAEEPRQVKQFLREYEASYPVLLDPDQHVARKFGITAHPVTLLIDRAGVVRFVHTGFLKGDEITLENAVKALLEGGKIARR